MKKTNIFLKQCFAILTMGAMLFSISCSESDVDLDVEDDDGIIDPDLDDDDDVSSDDAGAIATFVKYVEAYAEYIPQDVVATLEEIDADINGTPEDIVGAIALHVDAIELAAEGLVITSISNDVDTLSFTYRNSGVSGFASISKGGVEVSVSDKTASSLVVIEVGDYTFSFPKGYATNITGLVCNSDKIAIAPGAKCTVDLELQTLNDVGANGYLNYVSGFTIYAANVVSTKSTLEAISPESLRVVSAEFASSINKTEASISIMMSSDVDIDWGGEISIQYGSGTRTDDITFTSLTASEIQGISYSYGTTEMMPYDAAQIDPIYYSYDPEASDYVNSFYLYFTGVDNSGDEVANDAVLSSDLAINSYEVKLYEILGANYDSGDVPVDFAADKNLILGTSEQKAAILSEITANVNTVVDEDLYLVSLGSNVWDYVSSKSVDDATINLNFALSALSPQDTKRQVYLLVVAGTTTGSSDNNCFVMSHVIDIKNDTEVYMRMYQTEEDIDYQQGTLEVSIESNYDWEVEVTDYDWGTNADGSPADNSGQWFTLSQEKGELDCTLEIEYDRNDNYNSARTATVEFKAYKEYTNELIDAKLVITQIAGKIPEITFPSYGTEATTASENVTYVKGSVDINVESNTSWKIVQQPSWASASVSDEVVREGEGDALITINYDANNADASRDDQFVFQITDSYANRDTYGYIKLHQAGVETPYITIDDTSDRSFGSKGGEFTVDITSNFDWTITSDASWITMPVASGKYNESQVVISYDNHITDYVSGREATVTFTASDGVTSEVKTIKVSQNKAITPVTLNSFVVTGLNAENENIMYTIKNDTLTVDQIFGLSSSDDPIKYSDLKTESNIIFNQKLSTGISSTVDKIVMGTSLDETSHISFDIPMTLSTNGTFTAETMLTYTNAAGISEVVVLDIDFEANGYPLSFRSCLESMIMNDGNVIPDEALTSLTYQYTSQISHFDYSHNTALLDASGIDNSSNVPVGFIEPFIDLLGDGENEISEYLSTMVGQYDYCEFIYVNANDPTVGYGNITNGNTSCVTIPTSSLVAKGATGTGSTVSFSYTGTILDGLITTRYSEVYSSVQYKIYARVTFKANSVEAWYDTGFTFAVAYTL